MKYPLIVMVLCTPTANNTSIDRKTATFTSVKSWVYDDTVKQVKELLCPGHHSNVDVLFLETTPCAKSQVEGEDLQRFRTEFAGVANVGYKLTSFSGHILIYVAA